RVRLAFPTRRSSDLPVAHVEAATQVEVLLAVDGEDRRPAEGSVERGGVDARAEQLRLRGDGLDVPGAGDQPQVHRRHPGDGLLRSEEHTLNSSHVKI